MRQYFCTQVYFLEGIPLKNTRRLLLTRPKINECSLIIYYESRMQLKLNSLCAEKKASWKLGVYIVCHVFTRVPSYYGILRFTGNLR